MKDKKANFGWNKAIQELSKLNKSKPIAIQQNEQLKTVKQIAQAIADKVHMPYCWEDIMNRLEKGLPLPFKLTDKNE